MPVRGIAKTSVTLAAVFALALAGPSPAADRDPDGAYEGRGTNVGDLALDQVAVEFDVSGDGTRVKNWVVRMNAICVVFPGPVELQFVTQPMPAMKIKRDGRFAKVFEREVEGEPVRVEVSGRLKGTRVKQGTISYRVGVCYRGEEEPIRWEAQRTGGA